MRVRARGRCGPSLPAPARSAAYVVLMSYSGSTHSRVNSLSLHTCPLSVASAEWRVFNALRLAAAVPCACGASSRPPPSRAWSPKPARPLCPCVFLPFLHARVGVGPENFLHVGRSEPSRVAACASLPVRRAWRASLVNAPRTCASTTRMLHSRRRRGHGAVVCCTLAMQLSCSAACSSIWARLQARIMCSARRHPSFSTPRIWSPCTLPTALPLEHLPPL